LDQGATSQQTTTDAGKTILNQPALKEGEQAKTEEGKKEEVKGAPEKYADFTVPEGFQLDPAVVAKATPIFKELGLTQEAAQRLVDLNREVMTEALNAPYKAYQEMTSGWLKEAKDHPDLRGKLGPGEEVNVRIGKLLNSLPDQKLASDFRAAMDLTGVGNHPAFIRAIDYFAQQLTEGKHVAGNGPTQGGTTRPGASAQPGAAAAIWPGLKSANDTK
jgi:hypothetical protein